MFWIHSSSFSTALHFHLWFITWQVNILIDAVYTVTAETCPMWKRWIKDEEYKSVRKSWKLLNCGYFLCTRPVINSQSFFGVTEHPLMRFYIFLVHKFCCKEISCESDSIAYANGSGINQVNWFPRKTTGGNKEQICASPCIS